MEIADVKQRALLWGHLLVTLPAVAAVGLVLFFRKYLLVPSWPYYVTTGVALAYQWHTTAISRWRMALRKRGFPESEVEQIAENGGLVLPGASSSGLLAIHTTAAGLCAAYLNLWLVGLLVHWILPLIGQPAPPNVMDYYLQHFEISNVIPAFLLGCVMFRKFPALSTWGWLIPTAVIFYKLVTFVEPNASVLTSGNPWHRFSYYFVIQRFAPTLSFAPNSFEWGGADPVRVFEQITVVAAFYSSIAYSLGAFATKTKAWQRAWERLSREPSVEIIGPEEAGVVVVPESAEEPLQRT